MNILYLCDEYPPCQHGGIGTVTRILAREMVRKGHSVTVCGFYPYFRKAPVYEEDNGVRVFRVFYGNKLLLKLSRNKYSGKIINIEKKFISYTGFIKTLIYDNKIDIIEMPDFQEVFRYTGPRFISYPDFSIPVVVKTHGTYSFINNIEKGISFNNKIFNKEEYNLNKADLIIAISVFSSNILKRIFKYDKRIEVIYNGINTNEINQDSFIRNSNTVIFAGTLSENKGIFKLISAWQKVSRQIPDAKLLVYGKGSPSCQKRLKREINPGISHSIEFKGFVNREKLMKEYQMAACAVFPSFVESFGMAPIESMISGCPTIYSLRSTGNELMTNGIDGLLIDPDNPDEIADSILVILKDKSIAAKIGRMGREVVKTRFDIRDIAEKHLRLYSELVNLKKQAKWK